MKKTKMSVKKNLLFVMPYVLIVSCILVIAWIYLSEKWFVIILISGALLSWIAEVLLNSKSSDNDNIKVNHHDKV